MNSELKALYEIHRHQILFNCTDANGEFRMPKAYVYSVYERIFPYLHQEWCSGDDPYLSCYDLTKAFIEEVTEDLDRVFSATDEEVPTFYELEKKYSKSKRVELLHLLRYSYLEGRYDAAFYNRILTPMDHPTEASGITRDFLPSDVFLV